MRYSEIKLVEHKAGDTVTLDDLYDPHELHDESERIAHETSPMDHDVPLIVQTMPADQLVKLKNHGLAILDTYEDSTTKQKKIVAAKVKQFDPSRIVVLAGDEIIDGNHQIIAAIKLGYPVLYIDLMDLD